MSLSLVRAEVVPLPTFFSFVCTDEHGKHFYVACMQFMEELSPADILTLLHAVYGPGEVRAGVRPLLSSPAACMSSMTSHASRAGGAAAG